MLSMRAYFHEERKRFLSTELKRAVRRSCSRRARVTPLKSSIEILENKEHRIFRHCLNSQESEAVGQIKIIEGRVKFLRSTTINCGEVESTKTFDCVKFYKFSRLVYEKRVLFCLYFLFIKEQHTTEKL